MTPGRGYRFTATVDDAPVEKAPAVARRTDPTLIGREADLELVREHLERNLLVTLVGPGVSA